MDLNGWKYRLPFFHANPHPTIVFLSKKRKKYFNFFFLRLISGFFGDFGLWEIVVVVVVYSCVLFIISNQLTRRKLKKKSSH
jgi:hypothetical protein